MVRILHTSDWHLGADLYECKRTSEFEAWFDWLCETLKKERIDVLVVSGDIFDVFNPSNEARKMYFDFLTRVHVEHLCKHIVLTAGNHDSAAQLEATSEVLACLNHHVIGRASGDLDKECLPLCIHGDTPEIVICATPFLFERDVRQSSSQESPDERVENYAKGIAEHYRRLGEHARQICDDLGKELPIVAMGHLTVTGAKTSDGERKIIGTLDGVNSAIFGSAFDYVALGHLHVPQIVGKNEAIRYSGSPLPMSFSEVHTPKSVVIVSFESGKMPNTEILPVPNFQKLSSVEGNLEEIVSQLKTLGESGENTWIQVIYKGKHILSLCDVVRAEVEKYPNLRCLRIVNDAIRQMYFENQDVEISLGQLSEIDVFKQLLAENEVAGEEAHQLCEIYSEIVDAIKIGNAKTENEDTRG